jgi:hypothetical protein
MHQTSIIYSPVLFYQYSHGQRGSPLTWLGATGDWEKRHKDRHIEKPGIGWVQHSWWEMPVTSSTSSAFIYTAGVGKRGEGQVEFSWVQSCRRQEQCSCGMLLFTADSPDYLSMPCFPCKAALLNLASSWSISQGALWQSHAHVKSDFHCLSLPTFKAALLKLAHLLCARALPSQHKGPWQGLTHVKVLSQSV